MLEAQGNGDRPVIHQVNLHVSGKAPGLHHWVLLSGKSASFAALCGIASVVPTTWLRASTRRTFTLRRERSILPKAVSSAA